MTCYHPVTSLWNKQKSILLYGLTKQDLLTRSFSQSSLPAGVIKDGLINSFVEVPIDCGKCIGCMLRYRSGWIVRAMAQLFTNTVYHGNGKASFVTLTYDDEHLPFNASLFYEDIKLFMKKVRDVYSRYFSLNTSDIRFLCCGEYGKNNGLYGDSAHGRPHYHLIIFGVNFKEYFQLMSMSRISGISATLKYCEKSSYAFSTLPYRDRYMIDTHGTTALRSPLVESIWQRGVCVIGDVSAQSVGYTAGYNVKNKMITFPNKQKKQDYYTRNGEFLVMPFIHASKNFGQEFFDRFYDSIYTTGYVRLPNCQHSYPIPRIFNEWCKVKHPEYYENVCIERQKYFDNPVLKAESTPERLAVREEIKRISVSKLQRNFDSQQDFSRGLCEKLAVAMSRPSSSVDYLV